jgi:hypothetical protein
MKKFRVETVLGKKICQLYANSKEDAIAEAAYDFSLKNGYSFNHGDFEYGYGRKSVKKMLFARAI